jgi:signal transduction histidine kinase
MLQDLRLFLHEPRLWRWMTRLAWVMGFVVVSGIMAEMLPRNFRDTMFEWSVQQTQEAVVRVMPFGRYVEILVVLEYVVTAVYFGTALLIFWRKSDEWMAVFVSLTLLFMALNFGISSNQDAWRYPGWLTQIAPWAPGFLPPLTIACYLLLFFLFPNGRFTARWMVWPVGLVVGLLVIFWSPLVRNLIPAWAHVQEELAWPVVMLALAGAMVTALVAQVYRYRRVANAIERQQTKWVLFGLGLPLAYLCLRMALYTLLGWEENAAHWAIDLLITPLVNMVLPLTIAFSILRYRLWEIDLILRRTLVYGGLVLLISALYVLIVGGMSLLLQVSGSALLTMLATGLIAVLFQPLRQRLQQAVNRLMYGERDDPVTVLAALRQRLESTSTPEMILTTIVETLCHALKLPFAAIALKQGVELQIAASHGAPTAGIETIPLFYQREQIGELRTAPRAPGETLSAADHRLIQEIAQHAGAAAHAARLTADLQQSRERLVTAREEERRRLRRDLHDGLGPQLATLSLQVDAARNLLQRDPVAADRQLVEVKGQMQAAIADIRRLVYDLRPPALDQLGLVSALREYVASCSGANGLQITVDAPAQLPPLPAAVEVAAYRIALEAITNVVRHAQAHQCTVQLTVGKALQLAICDDGVGLPAGVQAGVGLTSLRERVGELGGDCQFVAAAGRGTQIRVELPLGEH